MQECLHESHDVFVSYILYFRRYNVKNDSNSWSDENGIILLHAWSSERVETLLKFNRQTALRISVRNFCTNFARELKNLDKYLDTIPLLLLSLYIFVYTCIYPRHAWNEIRIIHRDHEKCYSMKSKTLYASYVCDSIFKLRFKFAYNTMERSRNG